MLVAIGYFVSTYSEKRKFKSIHEREKKGVDLPSVTLNNPKKGKEIKEYKLVNGNIVVSINYFQNLLAGFLNLFGIHLIVNDLAIERARREAILRMKADVPNASEIVNMQMETSTLSSPIKFLTSIEVLVYGTAIYR